MSVTILLESSTYTLLKNSEKVNLVTSISDPYTINDTPFPDNFKFGVATAAHLVEGAWDADGKGPSIWDHYSHTRPKAIVDGTNGDVASDSYHQWKRDVQMLKELGVHFYRFSISWSRILPTGHKTVVVNRDGINYYANLIKELKRNNIEPMVTLYHWDIPQGLQDLGGWTNILMAEALTHFARICFEAFGHDVKYWLTINEPLQFCHPGYGEGTMAPGVFAPGIGEYMCAHNLLIAHARIWHLYNDEYRAKQNGKISMGVHCNWYQPESNTTKDMKAAEIQNQFTMGWFFHPIFFGDYPKAMRDRIALRSERERFTNTRIPRFTAKEIEFVKGTHDFLGLNYYSAFYAKAVPEPPIGPPSYVKDTGAATYAPSSWEATGVRYIKNTPWGFRKILKWIKDEYNNPEIFITENGIATNESYNDRTRIRFIKEHLSSLRDAMMHDGVNVTLYTIWSLLDGFQWNAGYTAKFGLYETDFNSPQKTRKPRRSVEYYKHIIKTKSIVWPDENKKQ